MIVFFDVVGTLFSLEAARAALVKQGVPGELLELWFARLLQSSMAATMAGRYVPFKDMAESTLLQTLAVQRLSESAAKPALAALRELEPWEDASACLQRLVQDGHQLWALTNSSVESAESLLKRSGLRGLFVEALSTDQVRAAKPHLSVYDMAMQRTGARPREAGLVAAHAFDVSGADAAGLRTVWIRRLERRWPFPGDPPDAAVDSLEQVPDAIAGLSTHRAW